MSEAKTITINDWASSRPVWPGLAQAKREAIRAQYARDTDPEWVRRIEEARRYVENLVRDHAQGQHDVQHVDCPDCELTLTPEELVREHRGW